MFLYCFVLFVWVGRECDSGFLGDWHWLLCWLLDWGLFRLVLLFCLVLVCGTGCSWFDFALDIEILEWVGGGFIVLDMYLLLVG